MDRVYIIVIDTGNDSVNITEHFYLTEQAAKLHIKELKNADKFGGWDCASIEELTLKS